MSDEASTPATPTTTTPTTDPLVWVRRTAFLVVLAIGWLFILWQNRFHVTPPVVFVCLAFLAIVATVYTLWRTGVVAVTDEDGEDDSTWGRPLGARGELEREKKALLKAIKEAEFDREMGKLSKADAEEMIQIYRVRAIEVIKELDQLDAGAAGTVREQIEREVKARLEIETRTKKAAADAKAATAAGKPTKQPAKPTVDDPPADTTEPNEPASGAPQAAKEATR